MRSYHRLDIRSFGAHLLRTGDLDPVYIALHECVTNRGWSQDQLDRFLVAYWCYYHCGVASWMAEREGPEYWEAMAVAAANQSSTPLGDRWPRGKERRHFRGEQGIASVEALRQRYRKPEDMVEYIMAAPGLYKLVAGRVEEHRGFGPWIAFKVCDMLERICSAEIDFDQAAVFMFKDPVMAAMMVWADYNELPPGSKPKYQKAAIEQVVNHLTPQFAEYTAPPDHGRPVGLQEVETILCKWKSHMNGHYPLNNDIVEIREGVRPWMAHSKLAIDFLEAMPSDVC